MNRTPTAMLVFAFALPILVVAGIHLAYVTGPEFAYRKVIGANLDNAYDASTFPVMRENLLRGIQGMRDVGLQPSDCGRAWSWEQTRDWCMGYQYEYLNGLVNRTEYYIRVFAANNTPPFNDVYTQAMANVRAEFNRNGPVDWVARPAYLLKYHSFFYWAPLVNVLTIPASILLLVFAAVIQAAQEEAEERRRQEESERRWKEAR